MTVRATATAMLHIFVATFYAFIEDLTWLPHFMSSFAWLILLWIMLFSSAFFCAQENRALAVSIPVGAVTVALAAVSIVEGPNFSPGMWAAPLIVGLWTLWIFWPSLLGAALERMLASQSSNSALHRTLNRAA